MPRIIFIQVAIAPRPTPMTMARLAAMLGIARIQDTAYWFTDETGPRGRSLAMIIKAVKSSMVASTVLALNAR
jgi:hypothetical protein